jgi:outer membrane lipoprotein SlyB
MDQNRTYVELKSQGFSFDQMHVIEEASQFRNYMDCSYGRSMLKNTIASAAFIGSIFALIGMAAGVCESLAGMPTGLCIGLGVVLLLLGALIGGILGAVIGWAEVDRETHAYLAGLEKGHTLMLVQTEEEDSVALAQRIFKNGNAQEVQVCTRAHDPAAVQNQPQLELA